MNLAELFRHETELLDLPAGEALFREGEQGDLMYVVMSGTIEISVHGKVVETGGAGTILGEMALIDDPTRSATVTAKTDCRLFPVGQDRFNFLVQQTPNFALHVMKVMAYRLRVTDSYL